MDNNPTDEDRKQTADARYTAYSALAGVHVWRWERMGMMAEVQAVMGALERLRQVEEARETQEWNPQARRWVDKGPTAAGDVATPQQENAT